MRRMQQNKLGSRTIVCFLNKFKEKEQKIGQCKQIKKHWDHLQGFFQIRNGIKEKINLVGRIRFPV